MSNHVSRVFAIGCAVVLCAASACGQYYAPSVAGSWLCFEPSPYGGRCVEKMTLGGLGMFQTQFACDGGITGSASGGWRQIGAAIQYNGAGTACDQNNQCVPVGAASNYSPISITEDTLSLEGHSCMRVFQGISLGPHRPSRSNSEGLKKDIDEFLDRLKIRTQGGRFSSVVESFSRIIKGLR